MALWLKLIGTVDHPWPAAQPYDREYIGFRGRRPTGIRPGDKMILYAVRTGRIFALTEAATTWRPSQEPGWPYSIETSEYEISLAPRDGVDIDQIDDELKTSLRRRSHMRLTPKQFECAVARLRKRQNTIEQGEVAE
jgi:hypothetical protein